MTSVLVRPTVEVFFDMSVSGVDDLLTLDDATKGQLDDASYPLGGDVAVDVTDTCYRVDIRRGRNRETDEIDTGTCAVGLRNYDARWLPLALNDTRMFTESGEPVLDEDGNVMFVEAGVYLDQVDIGKRVRVSSVGAVVFDGVIDDFRYSYQPTGEVDAEFTAMDALGVLAAQEFDEWTTTGAQTAGPRIEAALDRSEVSYPASRDIDDGDFTLQSDTVSWGSNVLNYLQLVARSELGRLFVDRSGVLTFRDRLSLGDRQSSAALVANPPPRFSDDVTVDDRVLTEFDPLTDDDGDPLTDDEGVALTVDDPTVTVIPGTSIPYVAVRPATSAEVLYNRVQVSREGGTIQTANNLASQAKYRIRTLSLPGLLLSTDEQCANMATFLAGIYSTPQNRLAGLTVALEGLSPADQAKVTHLDIGDLVSVTWTPTGAVSATTQLSVVEGITHSVGVGDLYTVTLSLSPITQSALLILDDENLAQLDSGVLAF